MTRRGRWLVSSLLLALGVATATAQVPAPPPGFQTGDAWIDVRLADINRYGASYPEAFVDELVRYHGAPREFVLEQLEHGWTAGELYYACAVATVLGRSCRQVADLRGRQADEDWSAFALQLGLKPGSAQAQRLRAGLVASYARWGRPLPREPVHASTAAKTPARALLPEPPPRSAEATGQRR